MKLKIDWKSVILRIGISQFQVPNAPECWVLTALFGLHSQSQAKYDNRLMMEITIISIKYKYS